jgi:hypothetical protein
MPSSLNALWPTEDGDFLRMKEWNREFGKRVVKVPGWPYELARGVAFKNEVEGGPLVRVRSRESAKL